MDLFAALDCIQVLAAAAAEISVVVDESAFEHICRLIAFAAAVAVGVAVDELAVEHSGQLIVCAAAVAAAGTFAVDWS